jgi:hypothetical protein
VLPHVDPDRRRIRPPAECIGDVAMPALTGLDGAGEDDEKAPSASAAAVVGRPGIRTVSV